MKMSPLLAIAGIAGMMMMRASSTLAQADNFDFSRFDPSQFDPAQMQKRMMDGYREQLEITNDAEWKIVEQRIQKIQRARREAGFGGAMGGMGGMARLFGSRGQGGGGQLGGGFSAFLPKPSPEEEALQKALDAKAPSDELKAALAKFIEARKQKQANLEKAQAELRAVLSVRQEVSATLAGLL